MGCNCMKMLVDFNDFKQVLDVQAKEAFHNDFRGKVQQHGEFR